MSLLAGLTLLIVRSEVKISAVIWTLVDLFLTDGAFTSQIEKARNDRRR
ncbi:MAG TPA: hypothetical protein VG796_30575 [Verrucomicrobiales bacterium]|nr:hypothetical protein [Verrucomicrobiales bacterium]